MANSTRLNATLAASKAGSTMIVHLPAGFTCVETSGAGPAVVLVHGMTSPSLIWERVAPILAQAGFRVVRYDLYGRGLSARPNFPLTPEVYHAQLDTIIADNCVEPPVVVGYSWGAGIVAGWAAPLANRVRRVVLVAPGGIGPEPWINPVLRLPYLGELLVSLGGRRGLLADVARMFASPESTAAYLPRFVEQLSFEGYDRCFLSTLRHCPPTWESTYAALGASGIPVDGIWGNADIKVPIALAERLAPLIPHAKLRVVNGGAHGMPWEAPEAFSAALIAAIT